MIVAGLGGIAVAAAITFALPGHGTPQGTASQPVIAQVAVSEVGDAIATMSPGVAAQAAEEARNCQIPLANIVLTNAPGASSGLVRVRSGRYLSPPFLLTDAPQRIAIPFPAPYQTGKGTILVEGAASGTTVTLAPTITVNSMTGGYPINVWWTPRKSC